MRRSNRGSAGEESDEEWVEEQIEREESTESLDELGLPLTSSKSSSGPRTSASHGNLDSANLIVLDFGPTPKGLSLKDMNLLLISGLALFIWSSPFICFISSDLFTCRQRGKASRCAHFYC